MQEPVYARVADDADDAGQGYAAYTYMTRIRAEDFIGLNYKFDLLWVAMGAWNDESKLCPITLSSGIPPQVVMKWTGHCDYKSMKPYIDIAGKTKSDAMNTFANSLSF